MYIRLDSKSRSIARIIDYKYGSRIAARFIVRAYKVQQKEAGVKKNLRVFGVFAWALASRCFSFCL